MATVNGTAGNDNLEGTSASDVLSGFAGNDVLYGNDGSDTLYGGDGDDDLFGGASVDQLWGGAGDDYFWVELLTSGFYDNYYGGSGYDTITTDRSAIDIRIGELSSIERIDAPLAGTVPATTIIGSEIANNLDFRSVVLHGIAGIRGAGGDDTIYDNDEGRNVSGDAGKDTLHALGGNDIINGGAGDDTLYGGDGEDLFLIEADGGFDIIDGGAGDDIIEARASNLNMGFLSVANVEVISSAGFTNVSIVGSGGSDTLDFSGSVLQNITAIRGGAGFDAITGSTKDDKIYGDAGNDVLAGAGGNDLLDGGDGYDTAVFVGNRDDYSTLEPGVVTNLFTGERVVIAAVERLRFDDDDVTLVPKNNTAPPAPSDANSSTNAVAEGAANGALVGLTARSVDADVGDSVIYELIDNAGGRFAINQTTGVVSVANGSLIDFETASAYAIQIRTYDGLDYSAASAFTIGVTNLAPTAPRDYDGNATNNLISENVASGTVVADLELISTDAGGSPVSYVLTDASGKFELEAATGQIKLKVGQSLDYEAKQNFTVSIAASDGTATTAPVNFTINVANVLENQTYVGTAGNDTLSAVSDDNWDVDGAAGNDTLTTRAGVDVVRGGAGDDIISTGGGDDTILVGLNEGVDNVNGGVGNDTLAATADNVVIRLKGLSAVETITANGFAGVTIAGSIDADNLDFTATTLVGITGSFDGGTGADTIRGTALADTIIGGLGADSLYGNAGDDTFVFGTGLTAADADALDGGIGFDQAVAASDNAIIALRSLTGIEAVSSNGFANVTVLGTANSESYNFSAVSLTGIAGIYAGAGTDTVTGSSGDDFIDGGDQNDTLNGGDGNDTLYGGAGGNSGNDVLNGGNGDDIFLFQANGQVDQFFGGAGYDSLRAVGASATVTLGNGNTASGRLDSIEEINSAGFANVTVGLQSQWLGSSWASQSLDLTSVSLVGISGIIGSAGNDTIIGSAGADTISGDSGNDRIFGGGGDDTFRMSTGSDSYDGGAGSDSLLATAVNQSINAAAVMNVEAISSNGFSGLYLVGTSAAETIDLSGVTLTGVGWIDAGLGNDTITASSGNDVLKFGAGKDVLTGGLGSDVFDFDNLSDSSGTTVDRITDFASGLDRIDLATIDANASLSGDQAFSFIGDAAFSGVRGQLRFDSTTTPGLTTVFGDLDGNMVADFQIELWGTLPFQSSDFFL